MTVLNITFNPYLYNPPILSLALVKELSSGPGAASYYGTLGVPSILNVLPETPNLRPGVSSNLAQKDYYYSANAKYESDPQYNPPSQKKGGGK